MTVLSKIAHALRMLAGVIVVVLVLITGYDVIMRYVFALPLDWSITISSVGLIAIIMLAIPDVSLRGEHIAMDLFYRQFSPRLQRIADGIVAAAVFGGQRRQQVDVLRLRQRGQCLRRAGECLIDELLLGGQHTLAAGQLAAAVEMLQMRGGLCRRTLGAVLCRRVRLRLTVPEDGGGTFGGAGSQRVARRLCIRLHAGNDLFQSVHSGTRLTSECSGRS